ncbi:TPA: MarR family winged helix-turn-helix transcriptional regulator [Photobacterium damselae]
MEQTDFTDSLFTLVHTIKRHVYEQVEALELEVAPMHVRVLKIINKKSPHCTANDIAIMLTRDKAQITRLVNTLIAQSLVEKRSNSQDRRSQFLVLTQEGEDLIKKIRVVDESIKKKMMNGLTEKELQEITAISQKMVNNLKTK